MSDEDDTATALLESASERRRTRSWSREWIDSSSCATGLDIPEFFLLLAFKRRSDDDDVAFVAAPDDVAVDAVNGGGVDIEVISIPACWGPA